MRLIDADKLNLWTTLRPYCSLDVCCEVTDIIDNAPTVNPYEWISVEDRLPEDSGQYLVTNGKKIIVMMFQYPDAFTAFRKQPNFCYWDNDGDGWWVKSTFPTHWMPLPALPTEKKPQDKLTLVDNNKMLWIGKENFRCSCGGNVFSEYKDGDGKRVFECHSCKSKYEGE